LLTKRQSKLCDSLELRNVKDSAGKNSTL